MIITHIVFTFNNGGLENMLIDIIKEQDKHNKIYLIVSDGIYDISLINDVKKHANVIILKRNKNISQLLWLLIFIFSILKTRADVIHCHAWKFIKIIRFFKCKKILTLHNRANDFWSYNKDIKYYDKVISISNFVRQDFLKSHICDTSLIYNGISFQQFKTRKTHEFDTFEIIQIGRLFTIQKGQDILIRSVHKLIHEYNFTNFHLTLVGNGPSRKELQQLIKELKLNNYCTLLGLKTRKWIYQNLCTFNLLVQPSRNEGFGLTVVEGMAAKIPVLVSDIEGPREIIDQGELGYIFKSESIDDCSSALMEIIQTPPEKIQKHVEKSYIIAQQNFDIQTTTQKYLNIYKQN